MTPNEGEYCIFKNAKELFEKLNNDPAFANEVADRLEAKKDAGAENVIQASIEVAGELGYEVTADDILTFKAADDKELTVDELDDVAGGYIYNTATDCNSPSNYEVINDKTGNVMARGITSKDEAMAKATELGQSTETLIWQELDNLRKNPRK